MDDDLKSGFAVPMVSGSYIEPMSALMISPPTFWAIFKAKSDLPVAVAPEIKIT